MLVGSSPGSCTPMQVRVNLLKYSTTEVSMNRQLHPTTPPPGLDRRELFNSSSNLFSSLKHSEELEHDCSSSFFTSAYHQYITWLSVDWLNKQTLFT
jgi:hypothetical protein